MGGSGSGRQRGQPYKRRTNDEIARAKREEVEKKKKGQINHFFTQTTAQKRQIQLKTRIMTQVWQVWKEQI
jgi:hypothetical protein